MFSSQWSGTLVSQTGPWVRTIEGCLVACLTRVLAWTLLFCLASILLVGFSEIILCSKFGSCLYKFEVQQKSGVLTGRVASQPSESSSSWLRLPPSYLSQRWPSLALVKQDCDKFWFSLSWLFRSSALLCFHFLSSELLTFDFNPLLRDWLSVWSTSDNISANGVRIVQDWTSVFCSHWDLSQRH